MPRKTSAKRSEIVTVRLDPRLKYLAEIAARKQRRPLSGYIEWAVEQSLLTAPIRDFQDGDSTVWEADRQAALWDIEESVRVASLALRFPELLTYEEQLIWRLVSNCGLFWRGDFSGPNHEWQWKVVESGLMRDRLRKHWQTFKQVASGELAEDSLPTWTKIDPSFDIPF